jgi:dienelactone hydrolase
MEREELTFPSGETICAAWLYRPPGASGDVPCVVMSHGFSLTRHDGLATYAEALARAGAAVLVFDHRYLGDSGGLPRQRVRIHAQAEDVRNAVATARQLPGIDPERIILWGFSFSGGTAVIVGAADPRIAGLILLCPMVDGLARATAAMKSSPATLGWIVPRALRDKVGSHTTIPVTGPPGSHAAMTFPGESDGFAAAIGAGSPWRNEISPAVFLSVASHRPVRHARSLRCPVWVGLGERDVSVENRAVERLAANAPHAELHRYDVDHFEPFYGDMPERIAADQADWLARTIALAVAAEPA